MPIDLDEYEQVNEFGGLTKYQQSVRTPGHNGDEALAERTVYTGFGKQWLVQRVSTLGWNVVQYDDGTVQRRSASVFDYFEEEASAHETARDWVEEVAE